MELTKLKEENYPIQIKTEFDEKYSKTKNIIPLFTVKSEPIDDIVTTSGQTENVNNFIVETENNVVKLEREEEICTIFTINENETIKAEYEDTDNTKYHKKNFNTDIKNIKLEKRKRKSSTIRNSNDLHSEKYESKVFEEGKKKEIIDSAIVAENNIVDTNLNKPYKCFCGKRFRSSSHIKLHERTHTKEKPYKCELCDKEFSQNVHLRQHQLLHTNENPFKCEICEKPFRQRTHLRMHFQSVHLKMKPFECSICSRRYIQNSDLRKHKIKSNHYTEVEKSSMKKKTKDDNNCLMCKFCNEKFKNLEDLINHNRTHSVEKNFQCQECNKSYAMKILLDRHITACHQENFKCETCSATFPNSTKLKSHLNKNHGKKFECQYCHKNFNNRHHFTVHLMIHTGEKPYKCDFDSCDRMFTYRNSLKIHRATHDKDLGDYVCEICQRKFVTKSNFNEHMMMHTKIYPFKCAGCKKTFKRKSGLKSHICTGIN